jgi:uncharacterized membrane protein YeaQ/YmgE (transglycosylase-associated protein family)
VNILIGLLVGALVGWAAGRFMRANPIDLTRGIFLNILTGCVGAVVGGWLLSALLGVSSMDQRSFSIPSLFVSFMGAVILLVFVNFARQRAMR